MTLNEQQWEFARLVGKLLVWIYDTGYEVTLGDAYRSPEDAKRNAELGKGIANSLHTLRLAIDLNLFKDGKYLQTTEDHRPLGTYWKSLHSLCRWGGDFRSNPDGNHYSMTWQGIQ